MERKDSLNRDELIRQARAHVQSLKLAGVEWVPVAEALPPVEGEGRKEEDSALTTQRSPLSTHHSALTTQHSPLTTQHASEDRRQALKTLAQEIAACCKCAELVSTRTQTVFGDGGPGVELCFVGEAPGADEDAQGLPFVGAAGQLLNKIIAACGMKRKEVYICNIIKCRPPGNPTPLPTEAPNCRSFPHRQLHPLHPQFLS